MQHVATVGSWVTHPSLSLAALAEGGKRIQLGSLEIGQPEGSNRLYSAEQRERAVNVLREFADILELHVIFCASFEAAESLAIQSLKKPERDELDRLIRVVRALTGLEPSDVVDRGKRFFPPDRQSGAEEQGNTSSSPANLEGVLLRLSASALSGCSITLVEEVSADCGRHHLGHRCRIAYDWLRSFVYRHGAEQAKQVRTAGVAYAEKRLSLDEVASVIGVSVDEAIFLLERHGYSRAIANIRLSPEERKLRLAKLRSDRLARNDQPTVDKRLVLRDVVASQRIEDLDARPWLPTTTK